MSKPVVIFLAVAAPILSIILALLGLETLSHNILGWFLLVFGIAYPAGAVIYWFFARRPFWEAAGSGNVVSEERGDRSFWAILPGFLAVFFLPPLDWMFFGKVIGQDYRLLPWTTWLQAVGLALILLSLVLRVWARSAIRGLYSGHVEVREQAQLVRSGPYRFVRHPGYSGFLLMALGLAAGYSSLAGLIAVIALLLPGLVYRLRVEETLLEERFGEDYREYRRKTKALVPWVW